MPVPAMIYVHLWKEKSRIYGFLIWPNLHYMLQSLSNAASLEGERERERGWKLSSTISVVSSFLFFLSLTYQLYHILSLLFFFFSLPAHFHTQEQQHIHTGARAHTHTHTHELWTLLITRVQVHHARKLTHAPRAAPHLGNTFTSLAPIFSHFFLSSFSASSPFFLLLPHSAPPPSTTSTYRSILFIVKAIVPMATSELLIAKVLYI